jgi:hypothetical protein
MSSPPSLVLLLRPSPGQIRNVRHRAFQHRMPDRKEMSSDLPLSR